MATVAFGGEETVWGLDIKLCGDLSAFNHDGCQGKGAIPQIMQLIVGRTGQEYNQRKNQRRASGGEKHHLKNGGKNGKSKNGTREDAQSK